MQPLLWHEDPDGHEAMASMGLREEGPGHWVAKDEMKEIVDYGRGIMLVTRIYLDRPEFDVRTMHADNGRLHDIGFLNDCLREHIAEILAATERLKKDGMDAVKTTIKS